MQRITSFSDERLLPKLVIAARSIERLLGQRFARWRLLARCAARFRAIGEPERVHGTDGGGNVVQ